jgi:hypothetical protein
MVKNSSNSNFTSLLGCYYDISIGPKMVKHHRTICPFYNKSKRHTTRYFILQMTILATSALIPIINIAFSESQYLRLFSAILGSMVLVSTGLQLTKSHESMIIFRMVTARLLEDYYLFLQKKEYAKRDDEKLFIQKEESLIYDATSEKLKNRKSKKHFAASI